MRVKKSGYFAQLLPPKNNIANMQSQKRKIFLIAFALIAIGDWTGQILGLAWLDFTFKPLIMPALMLFLWVFSNKKIPNGLAKWVLIGQFFSWCGDISLMFGGKGLPFILGLGSFLIAHIAYTTAFVTPLPAENERKKMYIFTNYSAFLPLLFFLIIFYSYMQPYLGELEIPVLIYGFAIMCMAGAALNRYRFTTGVSFRQIFAGSLLFLVSDTVLAYSLFVKNFPLSGLLVMITYIGAQYLISEGTLNHQVGKERF